MTEDLGVNLAGVEVIIRMSQQMTELQSQLERLETEIARMKQEQT